MPTARLRPAIFGSASAPSTDSLRNSASYCALLLYNSRARGMQHTQSLPERPLGAVIEAIASDQVAPGAGSAAAVGLALAAACAGKAVAITLKHRHDAVLMRAQNELTS